MAKAAVARLQLVVAAAATEINELDLQLGREAVKSSRLFRSSRSVFTDHMQVWLADSALVLLSTQFGQ